MEVPVLSPASVEAMRLWGHPANQFGGGFSNISFNASPGDEARIDPSLVRPNLYHSDGVQLAEPGKSHGASAFSRYAARRQKPRFNAATEELLAIFHGGPSNRKPSG